MRLKMFVQVAVSNDYSQHALRRVDKRISETFLQGAFSPVPNDVK